MGPDQQRLSPGDRSNLVAYLDGELNEAEARAIATKLTQSMTARREVEILRKTWEMLDLLSRPKASQDFAARTLTVIVQRSGRGDRVASAASEMARKAGMVVAGALLAGLLFAVGYFVSSRVLTNPSARLARDLSLAESIDEYRDVGSFDFLELLDGSSDFN